MSAVPLGNKVPDHVDPSLVIPFNIYNDARLQGDVHIALKRMHRELPEIFWTPENGGHWIATRFDVMEEVCQDHEHFSARGNHVPYSPDSMVQIPLNLDPPEHNYYRSILMRHFGPTSIKKLEPRVVYWAQRLVGEVADRGRCEFMHEVASLFPVSVFMKLMGLPLERLREYRALVVEFFGNITTQRWQELQAQISAHMRELLEARTVEPRDDLASKLLREELGGRTMTMRELEALTNLLFQAGMDTVANFAGFFFRYLGMNPDIQRQIRAQPEQIPGFVEEGFRLLGVVNNGRMLRQDRRVGGIDMRQGDIIICMLPLAGLDERRNPQPEVFDASRRSRDHMLFSKGVHLCVGHTLARAEMRQLIQEWFRRIPEFRIAPGYEPHFRAGQVMGLAELPLDWDLPIAAQGQ